MKYRLLIVLGIELIFNGFNSLKLHCNDNFWDYNHCLQEVHFGGIKGDNYISITKDDSTADYLAPHFVQIKPICLIGMEGTVTEKKPVAYVSGTRARVLAKFQTDCPDNFFIRGVGPSIESGQIIFEKQSVKAEFGQVVYSWTYSDRIFVKNIVKYFEKFSISWQVSLDGLEWKEIDKSENRLYVTYDVPEDPIAGEEGTSIQYRDGIGYEWFESLLHITCKNADLKNNKVDILNAIWSDFTDNKVRNAHGELLYYYNTWNLGYNSTTTGFLLLHKDGACYSWCSLLIDALKIHGIDQANDIVLVRAPPGGNFLIHKWKLLENPWRNFNTSNTLCDYGSDSYTIVCNTETDEVVKQVGTRFYYELYYTEIQDERGLIGQSAANPESWFNEHCLVYLDFMGKFYDPSYGKSYDSIEQFKNSAIQLHSCSTHRLSESWGAVSDPDRLFHPTYDFNGDGLVTDLPFMHEHRFMTDLSKLQLSTETYNR